MQWYVNMTSLRYDDIYFPCNITCSYTLYNLFLSFKDTYVSYNIGIEGKSIV